MHYRYDVKYVHYDVKYVHWFLFASERTTVPKVTQTKTKRNLRARNAKKISYAKMMAMDSEGEEEEEESSSDFIMSESDCSTSAGVSYWPPSYLLVYAQSSPFLCIIIKISHLYLPEPDSWTDGRGGGGGRGVGQWSMFWREFRNTAPRLQQDL